MHCHVEGYWKVRLVCLPILIIIFAVMTLCNNAANNIYEVDKTSYVIAYMDRLGIAL